MGATIAFQFGREEGEQIVRRLSDEVADRPVGHWLAGD